MSAIPSSLAAPSRPRRRTRLRPGVTRRAVTAALLGALLVALVLALPGMSGVIHAIEHIDPLWIVVAVALEVASAVSFVIVFRLFFDRLRAPDARALAWTSQASGALLPAGGVGGFAIGGWLTRLTGAPTGWIVRRTSALFFLSSAVSGAALIGAGLALVAGAHGPHGFVLTALPALLASAVTLAVLALPALLRRRAASLSWTGGVVTGITDAIQFARRPSWRLLGALGYLGFDIAVLWVVLAAIGQPMSVPALMLGYSIGYLANALPIPGGIGALDAGLAGALVLYGASPAHAAAAVLVYHAIALWIPGLGGLYAYARLRPRLVEASSNPTPQGVGG